MPTDPSVPPVTADRTVRPSPEGARPTRLHPRYLLAVATGGAIGATARYLIMSALAPVINSEPATMIINVAGCLLLGFLLQTLARIGPDEGARRTARLLIGTGLLGGFTTYSAFATDTALLLESGQLLPALGYALGSVLLGLLAAAGGRALAGIGRDRRSSR